MFCTNCGNEFTGNFCPNCGTPSSTGNQGAEQQSTGYSYVPNNTARNNRIVTCPCCGGDNVNISIETVGETKKGKSETRKKSIVTRAGNNIGRAGLIMATGGMWALTPKKSKYKTINKGNSEYIQQKIAVCQQCGNSWQLY